MVVGLLRKSPIFSMNLDTLTNDTEFSSSVDNDPVNFINFFVFKQIRIIDFFLFV